MNPQTPPPLPELEFERARPFAYQPDERDFDLVPVYAENGTYMLPKRDADSSGGVSCAHCAVNPPGAPAFHAIVAYSVPGQRPQRAWFRVSQLEQIRNPQDFSGHLQSNWRNPPNNWRNWTVDAESTQATLVADTGERYVWRLTDFYAADLRLGVWAD